MGLSGRKVKQRIGNDPRNLSWADDASRFGQSYLEKFGWDASKGLGASGEGRTNAVKMSQKLDMLGIGMQHNQNDPNGIAWRQNRDFENLLQRLNGGAEAKGSFHKARGSSSSEGEEAAAEAVDGAHDPDEGADADATKREKKRGKRKALQEEEGQEQEGSAREAARDKRERKKRKKSKSDVRRAVPEDEDDASPSLEPQAESTPVPVAPIAAPAPVRALPRAHRARIIAAKRMAASNSAALAEILGIPSCSSSTTATTATASPSPLTAATTPTPTQTQESEDPLQKLTTAALSVGDYLRAKLGAKAAAQLRPTSPPDTDADRDRDADADPPRAGLGAARWVPTGPPHEPVRAEAMFAAMFARGQAATGAQEEADGASVERAETHDDEGGAGDEEDRKKKSARRRAKEERRKMKEERRRRKEEEEEEAESNAITEPDAEPPNGAPVVEPSIGEARAGRAKRKKHCKSIVLNGLLEDSSALRDDRTVVVSSKKQKKRDKGRRDANP